MSSGTQLMAYEMNSTQLDDQMELGTSPYQQTDDIDFDDLDPMHDPSVDNSMVDEADFPAHELEAMHADNVQNIQDDDMIDDDDTINNLEVTATDLDPGEFINNGAGEDQVLYDEDEVDYVGIEDNYDTDPQSGQAFGDESALQNDGIANNQKREIISLASQNTADVLETHDDNSAVDASIDEHKLEVSNEQEEDALYGDEEIDHESNQFGNDNNPILEVSATTVDAATATSQASKAPGASGNDSGLQPDSVPTAANGQDTLFHAEPQEDESTLEANTSLGAEDMRGAEMVKIVYLGEEMLLFQPAEGYSSSTFFLSDASLASENLEKLLFACREVLGDSLGHEDELVLDIPVLGLHIFEDSKYASKLTLSKLIEVYSQLCQNESIESPEPLYCHLSSRVCLATQYAYLYSAAHEGKTFSEIAADYVDTPEAVVEEHSHQSEGEEEEQNQFTSHSATDQIDDLLNPEHRHEHALDEQQPRLGTTAAIHPELDQADGQTGIVPAGHSIIEQAIIEDNNDDGKLTDLLEGSYQQEAGVEEVADPEHSDLQPKDDDDPSKERLQDETQMTQAGLNINANEEAAAALASIQTTPIEPSREPQSEMHIPEQNYSNRAVDIESVVSTKYVEANGHDDLTTFPLTKDEILVEDVTESDDVEGLPSVQDENTNVTVSLEYSNKNDHHELESLETLTNNDANTGHENSLPEEHPELDVSGFEEDIAPVTPSKQSSASKRKAIEEEDDLDLFDISTPEPKRTRSS